MKNVIFCGWDNKLGLQDLRELIRYWSSIYVLCVSSHFWPFTKANLFLENFNKNLGFGQTPAPLVGPNAQFFPKTILMAPLMGLCVFSFAKKYVHANLVWLRPPGMVNKDGRGLNVKIHSR